LIKIVIEAKPCSRSYSGQEDSRNYFGQEECKTICRLDLKPPGLPEPVSSSLTTLSLPHKDSVTQVSLVFLHM
jgi:hypothetical protein